MFFQLTFYFKKYSLITKMKMNDTNFNVNVNVNDDNDDVINDNYN